MVIRANGDLDVTLVLGNSNGFISIIDWHKTTKINPKDVSLEENKTQFLMLYAAFGAQKKTTKPTKIYICG